MISTVEIRRAVALLGILIVGSFLTGCGEDRPETALEWYPQSDVAPARPAPAHRYADAYRPDGYSDRNYARTNTAPPKPKPAQGWYQEADLAPIGSSTPHSVPAPVHNSAPPAAARVAFNPDGPAAFAWPINGRVIADFGATSNGGHNDGINIAAPEGTPIHAAAAGTVSYAGNELKGYGNLVLIRHDNGFVTAYAHAERMLVARGDTVTKGQVIGYTGATGDVTSPQLHFEIRQGIKPLNPRVLLANNTAS
jgi:murein DD-endopeptidase MepM/ murein hydrolase activator NlpD